MTDNENSQKKPELKLHKHLLTRLIWLLWKIPFPQKGDPQDRQVRLYEFIIFFVAELLLIIEELVNLWRIFPVLLGITLCVMGAAAVFFLYMMLFPPRFSSTRFALLSLILVGIIITLNHFVFNRI